MVGRVTPCAPRTLNLSYSAGREEINAKTQRREGAKWGKPDQSGSFNSDCIRPAKGKLFPCVFAPLRLCGKTRLHRYGLERVHGHVSRIAKPIKPQVFDSRIALNRRDSAGNVFMPFNSLTQRRQGAKTPGITGSDCRRNRSLNGTLVFMKSISSNLCASASLRLCGKTRLLFNP